MAEPIQMVMTSLLTVRRVGRFVVVLFVVGAIVLSALPARAAMLGDMTSYRVTFPVDGDHHLWDTFWASRSHGIHHAQDIMADKGTPVVAAADGVVDMVNWSRQSHLNPSRCCSIVLEHDDGWTSTYIHLNNDSPGTDDGKGWGIADGIAPGERVRAGDVIGYVGDSGNAEHTPPHLHFELQAPDGTYVNPFAALLAAGGTTNNPNPSDPLLSGSRLLEKGERGADVARLQAVLNDLGHGAGATDGIFGPATDAAVRSFQAAAGITVDGLVGVGTRGALSWEVAPPTAILRQGSRGHDVRLLQEKLIDAGFDPGGTDGIFGPRTLMAVLAFQDDSRLVADGLVGPKTKAALGF